MVTNMATWEQLIRQESNRWFNGPPDALEFYSANMVIICIFFFYSNYSVRSIRQNLPLFHFWVVEIYGHRASLRQVEQKPGGRGRMSNTIGVHPLSRLLSNNRLEKVPFVSMPHTSSNRLLLSNQDKGCTPSVAHSLPLPLGPALLNLWNVINFTLFKFLITNLILC